MKNFEKIISAIILTTVIIIGCSKNDETNAPLAEYVPTKAALSNLFSSNLEAIKQKATFDPTTNYTFTSTAGSTVTIYGGSLLKNGVAVTGNVDLEFIEVFDRGMMALTNKTTMGTDTNGDLVALDSGGEFLVTVKQGGVNLTTSSPYELKTPTANTGGTKTGIQPFSGTVGANGDISWAPAQINEFYVTTNPNKYNALLSTFNWFNYDKLPASGPRTSIQVNIPSQYINASTVFLSTNTMPNSLGGIAGKWNIGLACNIIFLAEENGNFRYAIKPITVVNNQVVTFNTSETAIATPAQMKTILNNLP